MAPREVCWIRMPPLVEDALAVGPCSYLLVVFPLPRDHGVLTSMGEALPSIHPSTLFDAVNPPPRYNTPPFCTLCPLTVQLFSLNW